MAKAKKAAAKKAAVKKTEATSALAITKQENGKLTPDQAAFNKLTTRIEKLRKEIEKKEAALDEAIKLHGQSVPALQDDVIRQRHKLLLLMWPFYQQKKLPKTAQPYLKDMLQDMISDVLRNSPDEPDDELKAIFTELEGESYDAVLEREEKQIQDELRSDFKSFGVDVDWDEDVKLSDEEMDEKMNDLKRKVLEKNAEENHRRREQFKARPKTEKQLQKEKREAEAEQLKQKNITTIYRQLAKLFHPDLEQDEDRRLEKESLMKSLTEAYENKNLHTLLMLELKWIHNENNHLESLTEEKLSIYLDILRSQAVELENDKYKILYQPRYSVLVEHYGFRPLTYPLKAVKEEIAQLESDAVHLQQDIAALQSSSALQYLKKLVAMWREQAKRQQHNMDDFAAVLNMMFSGKF